MPVRTLPPVLAEKARLELNEDPERLRDSLIHIKEWLAKQQHLHARTDDQWLAAFLRGCKFSLERTKEKLDLYYCIRNTAPEIFAVTHQNPIFYEVLEAGGILPLPRLPTPDSPRILIMRAKAFDSNGSILDFGGVMNEIQKIMLMEDDNTVVGGTISILDLEGVTLSLFKQMTPALMKKMTVFSQDAVPLRMKGAHYINTPKAFETIYNFMKTFLNEKNKNRVYVHDKNYEELYKYIPKDILPVEYGGNGGTVQEIIDYWKRKVQEYSPWLVEDLKYGSDESKRPGKPKTAEDMFGLDGSFRQLQFD